MRMTGSVSSRSVSSRLKGATDTILGTGADTADVVCDTRSGTLLTFVLLFVVGWIPTIGQMVAGYVGGRRSGSPYRGLFATSVATACFLVVLTLIALLLDSINGALSVDYQAEIDALSEQSTLLAGFAASALEYLRALFGGRGLSIAYASYLITPVFGIIGGVVSNQMQKELRYIIRTAGGTSAQRIRSMERHRHGRSMGFSYSQISAISAEPSAHIQPTQVIQSSMVTNVSDTKVRIDERQTRVADAPAELRTDSATTVTTQKVNPFDSILSVQKKKAESTDTFNTSTMDDPVSDDDQYL